MVEYRGWPLDPLDPCGSLMRVGGTHPKEKVKDREMAGLDLLRSWDRKWGGVGAGCGEGSCPSLLKVHKRENF
jgi:hypothetical protein